MNRSHWKFLSLGAVTLLVGEETLTWAEMDKVSFQAAA